MKKWLGGVVAGGFAWLGATFVAFGLVDPASYNAVVTPEFVEGVCAFVGLVVTGTVNLVIAKVTGKIAGGEKKDEAEKPAV